MFENSYGFWVEYTTIGGDTVSGFFERECAVREIVSEILPLLGYGSFTVKRRYGRHVESESAKVQVWLGEARKIALKEQAEMDNV